MNMYVYVSITRYQHTRKPPEIRLLLPVRPGENLALVEQRDDKARPIHPSDHERGKFMRMPSRSFWLPPVKWNSERALLRRCHHSWLGYGDYAADVTLHGPCCPNEDWKKVPSRKATIDIYPYCEPWCWNMESNICPNKITFKCR